MAPQLEISIPNTTTSLTSKSYTIYNISLRLPLRSYSLQKRYSDFTALNVGITSEAGGAPPTPLPGKSWFRSTTSSPDFTEERRKGLESYVQAINQSTDDRWRNTSAWRTFLNLPSAANASKPGASLSLLAKSAGNGVPITDPLVWLDQHRDLKTQLHEARLNLTRRDQASTAQSQHEASAQAKKCLIRAGSAIVELDTGLRELGSARGTGERLGEGELRRRRDLMAVAKKEKEGLESLLSAMTAKAALDRKLANPDSKKELLSTGSDTDGKSFSGNGNSSRRPATGGRVLGKETDRTRELDNQGVVQLQQQMMQEQDEDVGVLAKAVARQNQLAIQIQEELESQNGLLDLVDEDVTRLHGKINVARDRAGKIS